MGASFFISEAEILISHLGFFENRIGQQLFSIESHPFTLQPSQGYVTRRPRPPHFKRAPTTFQNQRPWNDKTALPRLRDKVPPPPAFQKKPTTIFRTSFLVYSHACREKNSGFVRLRQCSFRHKIICSWGKKKSVL